MEQRISKLQLALLYFNVTGYMLAKELLPDSSFNNASHKKSYGFFLTTLIGFGLFDFVFNHILKVNLNVAVMFTAAFMLTTLLLDIVYKKKIELISDNYFTYYNIIFPVLFVLSSIAGLVYLFMHA